MKDVCKCCKYQKPRSPDYCFCVKYGCQIRYGRVHCISWERSEKLEQVRQPEDGAGRDAVRQP